MLTIGLEQLLAISGPISFTVLTPTDSINQIQSKTQPIIVLLGDNHASSGTVTFVKSITIGVYLQ